MYDLKQKRLVHFAINGEPVDPENEYLVNGSVAEGSLMLLGYYGRVRVQ